MTTSLSPGTPRTLGFDAAPSPPGPIPFSRLVRVEWTKATDTRAARWLLAVVALSTAGMMDQDRSRWDRHEIAAASGLLVRAIRQMQPGPYQLQAVIASHHAVARTAADTDWQAIVGAYGQLVAMTDSPVVRLNHAVALAMARTPCRPRRPRAGRRTRPLPPVPRHPQELLARASRPEEAAEAFTTAISLTANDAERRHLARRRATVGSA